MVVKSARVPLPVATNHRWKMDINTSKDARKPFRTMIFESWRVNKSHRRPLEIGGGICGGQLIMWTV